MRRLWSIVPRTVLGMTALIGCGGGGEGDVTGPPGPAPVATVTVSLGAGTLTVGENTQATATLRDASGTALTGRQVSWSSSNTAVASVSSQGLVTAVGEGAAQITASSEGKSGQAALTVNPPPVTDPQVSGLTVLRNGQPIDLNQVAGDITLDFTLELPSGYTGTLVVTLDTVEFLREPVSAPALSARLGTGSDAVANVVTSHRSAVLETARTSMAISSVRIEELPNFPNNIDLLAKIAVVPAQGGGTGFEQSITLRGMNSPHAHLVVEVDGVPVSGQDGKTYTGGTGRAAPIFATYSNETVTSFDVAVVSRAATYGPGTLSGVVQFIPRNNRDIFTFDTPAVEQADLTFVLDNVTIGGQTFDPQTTLLGGANTSNLNYSGWANTAAQVQGLTVPSGVSYVQAHQIPADLLGGTGTYGVADEVPFHFDNVGPAAVLAGPVFTYLDRQLTVGEPALDPTFGLGATWSQLGPGYDFGAGLHRSRLDDATGVDAIYEEYYVAPVAQQDNLFDAQYRLSASYQPTETGSLRTYVGGVSLRDGRGNRTGFYLTTSPGNPYRASGGVSDPSGYGIDRAVYGWNTMQGNLDINTLPSAMTWNQPTLSVSANYAFTASNSTVGLTDGWLSARGTFNSQPAYGAGTLFDQYRVMSSTGGPTGGTASLSLNATLDAVSANLGLTDRQGWYDFDFLAYDAGGQALGGGALPRRRRLLWDYTAPANVSLSYPNPIVAGTLGDAILGATDNIGLGRAYVGVQFDFPSPDFFGGNAYVPIGDLPLPGAGTTPITSLTMPLQGIAPVGFWFFDPIGGSIDFGNFYRSKAGMVQFRDLARNLSPIMFTPFTNTAPIPTHDNITAAFASQSHSSWCPGTCAGGGSNIVDLIFGYFDSRPSGTPVISKAEWFGLPFSGGGTVYPLGKTTTFIETPNGGGRAIDFTLSLDLTSYCGPSGPMLVFPIGYAASGQWLLKSNPFLSATVLMPNVFSNQCHHLDG